MSQFGGAEKKDDESNASLKVELTELRSRNQSLELKLNESESEIKKQRDNIKNEYDCYVEQLRHQIDSLVDQINRLTDEREDSFAKIDRLSQLLNASNKKNDDLTRELEEMKKTNESNLTETPLTKSDKESLLENEIKYFKQQIEILVHDHNAMVKIIEDKELSLNNLNKLIENYELDREKHNKLLEQMHNDKQTLSRAMQQNKELKDQLAELQDAFVNVTKQNLDLTTSLQAEKFKLENVVLERNFKDEKLLVKENEPNTALVSNEWDEEEETTIANNMRNEKTQQEPTLMNSIKERIDYLEKENKDLNDYIILMNKKLKENEENLANSSVQMANSEALWLSKINSLNDSLNRLQNEKYNLQENLSLIKKEDNKINVVENNNDKFSNQLTGLDINSKSYQLIEEKFNKKMLENADLREKNQELEHTIQQLQSETETIVDYITMYQMERSKLNEKYKQKDEFIRSLSTQLQINKLALQEIGNYVNAFIRFWQETKVNEKGEILINSDNEQKKQVILYHIIKILTDLTQNTSMTLDSINSSLVSSSSTNTASTTLNNDLVQSLPQNKLDNNPTPQTVPQINPKTLDPFKSEVVLCSSCYGDLFVV